MAISWKFKDFKKLITEFQLVINYLRLKPDVNLLLIIVFN